MEKTPSISFTIDNPYDCMSNQTDGAYIWDQFDFFFTPALSALLVLPRTSDASTSLEVHRYCLVSEPIYLTYQAGDPDASPPVPSQIIVSRTSSHDNKATFRDFLEMGKLNQHIALSVFNFTIPEVTVGNDGPNLATEIPPRPILSLRASGLGIIDIQDTDPMYAKFYSYDMLQCQKQDGEWIKIVQLKIGQGTLQRTNSYTPGGNTTPLTDDRTWRVLCIEATYEQCPQ